MKIPVIRAGEELPSRIPVTARVEGAGRVEEALGRLGGQVRELAAFVAEEEGEIQRKKQAMDMYTTLADLGLKLEEGSVQIATDLQREPDPANHHQKWKDRFSKMAAESISGIADPETLTRAKQLIARTAARESVEQKSVQNRIWVDSQQAKNLELLRDLSLRNRVDEGISLIDNAVQNGIFSSVKAGELKKDLIENAEVNTWKADSLNNAFDTYERFLKSPPQNLREGKVIQLQQFLEAQLRHKIVVQNQFERMLEKQNRAEREAISQNLTRKVMDGESVTTMVRDLLEVGTFFDDDATKILNFQDTWIKRKEEESRREKVDDPETDREFTKRLYSVKDPLTENDVRSAMGADLLTTPRAEHFLSGIWTRKKEFVSELKEEYQKAEEIVERALMTKGRLQELDPVSNYVTTRAIQELWQAVFVDKKNPLDSAMEIIERGRATMDKLNLPEIETMRKGILFGDKKAPIGELIIELRKNKDRISSSLYESQLQLLKDIADKGEWAAREKMQREEEKREKEGTKKKKWYQF